MVRLEQVGHAALAGLGVDAGDRLVAAADVLRVDRQVRHEPHELVKVGAGTLGRHLTGLQALLDGVLVGAGERGKHEVARIRMTFGDLQLVAVLDRLANLRHVGVIDLRIDALGEHVEPERDQIHVASTFAVAQQTAFHAVGAGQHGQLGGGNAHALVVVRVQGQHDGIAVLEVVRDVLDLVREHVRRGHLDCRRQVDDHAMVRRRLDHVDHRIAHLDRVIRFGASEGLRGILIVEVRALGFAFELLAQRGGVRGELLDAFLVFAEDDLALQHGDGIVEVHDRALGAAQAFVRLADQVLARLGEHDDGHVVGDELAFNQHADEIVVGFRSAREADLNLLEAHGHQQVPEAQLTLGIHRVDQRLVAVAQIDGAPARGAAQLLVRPRAFRELERHLLVVGDVLVVGHIARLLRTADESRRRQQRVVVPSVGRCGDCREIKYR